MEMKDGTSIEAHIKSMKELTDRLAAINAPIAEEDQVVTLLGSLPPGYSTLVTALEARDAISLSYVQQRLKGSNTLHTSLDTAMGGTGQALIGKQESQTSKRWQYKKTCYLCGESGHFCKDCPKNFHQKLFKSKHKAKSACMVSQGESHSDTESDETVFGASSQSHNPQDWIVDSGASSHMTKMKELLVNYAEFDNPQKVGMGDGNTVEAHGRGDIYFTLTLENDMSKKVTMCNAESVTQACVSVANEPEVKNKTDLWHQRLGHLNENQLREMASQVLVKGVKIPKCTRISFCERCVEGKMSKIPYKSVGEIHSVRRLQCVHSDVCGPMPTKSIGGSRYFVTFVDDYSRCCSVYFMENKSEVFSKFKEFELITTNACGCSIRNLRTDNSGEYLSKEFDTYLQSRGIRHELSAPYSPAQNGVAERFNRTLMESARTMMAQAGLSEHYWAEALATAAYLRNRVPTRSLKKTTPYEKWYGRKQSRTL